MNDWQTCLFFLLSVSGAVPGDAGVRNADESLPSESRLLGGHESHGRGATAEAGRGRRGGAEGLESELRSLKFCFHY